MNRWGERWQRLSRKERLGLAILGGLCLFFWGYQSFYRPQAVRLAKVRAEYLALRRQVAAVKTALPDLDQERQQLQRQTEEIDLFRQELESVESRLTTSAELGILLGELTKQGEGLQVTFDSIKQSLKENPEHPEVGIEVTFMASYEDLVNYLRRVERISPFLRIARLEVAEPKEGPKTFGKTSLMLVTPLRLSHEMGILSQLPQIPLQEKVTLPRSPFTSRKRPADETKRQALKVSGITWRGESSTAIINNEVVRRGDKIDHLTVKQILPDMVILTDGVESQAITLER